MRRTLRQQLSNEQRKTTEEILQDIESLLPHTQFLFDKINFQLEAAMGFTNLQQNKVIKIFSVAAVVFLRITSYNVCYTKLLRRIQHMMGGMGSAAGQRHMERNQITLQRLVQRDKRSRITGLLLGRITQLYLDRNNFV